MLQQIQLGTVGRDFRRPPKGFSRKLDSVHMGSSRCQDVHNYVAKFWQMVNLRFIVLRLEFCETNKRNVKAERHSL